MYSYDERSDNYVLPLVSQGNLSVSKADVLCLPQYLRQACPLFRRSRLFYPSWVWGDGAPGCQIRSRARRIQSAECGSSVLDFRSFGARLAIDC
jgi:hypothetical protein